MALLLPLTGAVAQSGGKPKIPTKPVLDNYNEAISADKLTISPVSTGLAALTQDVPPELEEPGLNPALYRQTIAGLQSYVSAIAKVGPRPDIIPRIRLERGDRPNAYAPSQDEIVLSTGMLKAVTENVGSDQNTAQQLLFILGHEYSHILYDHPRRFAEKLKSPGISKALSTALALATTVNKLSANTGGTPAINAKAMGTVQATYALSPLVELEIYRVTYAPYKKEQESLVDFASADLMERINYGDARDASKILSSFEKYDNSVIGQLKAGLGRLGADFKLAMDQIKAQAPATLLQSGPKKVLADAERNLLAVIARSIGDFIQRRFNKANVHLYYSAEKRVDGIQQYADRFYPRAAEAASQTTQAIWAQKAKVPTSAAFVSSFKNEFGPDEAAGIAKLKLLALDYAGARSILDAAKAKYGGSTAATPVPLKTKVSKSKKDKKTTAPAITPPTIGIKSCYFNMIDADTYLFEGRLPEATAAYARAIAQPEAPASAYLSLAAAQDLQGHSAAALAVLNNAEKKFGAPVVILAKIRHHVGLNEMDKASALVTACTVYSELKAKCAAAMPAVNKSDDDADDED